MQPAPLANPDKMLAHQPVCGMVLCISDGAIYEKQERELNQEDMRLIITGYLQVYRLWHGRFWHLLRNTKNGFMCWFPLTYVMGDNDPQRVDKE